MSNVFCGDLVNGEKLCSYFLYWSCGKQCGSSYDVHFICVRFLTVIQRCRQIAVKNEEYENVKKKSLIWGRIFLREFKDRQIDGWKGMPKLRFAFRCQQFSTTSKNQTGNRRHTPPPPLRPLGKRGSPPLENYVLLYNFQRSHFQTPWEGHRTLPSVTRTEYGPNK